MRGVINYYSCVAILVFMCIASKAVCDGCSDISVISVLTGVVVNGQREWKVTVANSGPCTLSQITLYCVGFMTAEAYPDVSIFSVQDDGTCLINGGYPLSPNESVFFHYAWNNIFNLGGSQGCERRC